MGKVKLLHKCAQLAGPTTRHGRLSSLVVPMILSLGACVCTSESDRSGSLTRKLEDIASAFTLDKVQATKDLQFFVEQPHVFGSDRQSEIAGYLTTEIQKAGSSPRTQPFTASVPNPQATTQGGPVQATLERHGTNVYAVGNLNDEASCVVALGSHYDTKAIDGLRYVGANDSGSSSVLLLELVRQLSPDKLTALAKVPLECDLIAIWFDGEEALLPGWDDGLTRHPAKIQDNTYGSRHAVSKLKTCEFNSRPALCLPETLGGQPLVALVLLDMVGSPKIQITRDSYSSPSLIRAAEQASQALGYQDIYDRTEMAIKDDHIPFREAGIAALNLIDFNNLDYWHAPGDELEKLSLDSMEAAGRIALYVALAIASEPTTYLARPK